MWRTHDDEDDGEHDESHELDRPATPGVDEEEANPVTGDQTGGGENQITDANVAHILECRDGEGQSLGR